MYLVTGSNLFGQWIIPDYIFKEFTKLTIEDDSNSKIKLDLNQAKIIYVSWSHNIFKVENKFYFTGSWQGKDNEVIELNFPEECDGISEPELTIVSNDYKLILIEKKTHNIWVMNLENNKDIKKLNFNIETPIAIATDNYKRMRRDDVILKVIATNYSCLCLTTEGRVYSGLLPTHVDTNYCDGKVCDIECGYEHFVLLTDSGKVYTWGNGRRLQLGHGDMSSLDSPTEVEALSGIKITKIKAGGWHSLALSEFGDLYAWGWNDMGQLGIKYQNDNDQGDSKVLGSYPVPTLVDIFDDSGEEISINVKDFACGTRHSAIILEDNSVWTSGYNKFGQLGLCPEQYPTTNFFKKCYKCKDNYKLFCGPWCTVLEYDCDS